MRGGLTEKVDFTEAQRNVWLHSRNTCAKVNYAMQRFVYYTPYTSEQHRDITEARLPKNDSDFKSVFAFLETRNPFTASCGGIMNIVSGVVGSEDVNIPKANDVGQSLMRDMNRISVLEYKFQRKIV